MHQRGGRWEPAGQVDRADHRLHGVREDRGLVPAAGALLAAPEQQVVAQAERACDVGQRPHVDHGGPQLGELALRELRVRGVQRVRDHQAEHGVAEELEPLVVRQAAVLIGVAAVGQGTQKQRLVDTFADHLVEVVGEPVGGLLRAGAVRRYGRAHA